MPAFGGHFRRLWRNELLRAGVYATLGASFVLQLYGGSEPVKAAEHRWPASNQLTSSLAHHVGLPVASDLRVFDGFVCAYDRRNRIPLWVMESLTPAKVGEYPKDKSKVEPIDRKAFEFFEDKAQPEVFRATNADYRNSGYDRGHMAALANHRFEPEVMASTFILSNVAPQVGAGFNRGAWSSLEKYVRGIARKVHNVVVITGPLFLPRQVGNKKFVSYEVIGERNVAVPTHFFKALAIQEKPDGGWRTVAYVMPNIVLPETVNLKEFQVPVNVVERSSGLKLFPRLSD